MRNNETGKDCTVREVMTDKAHGRTLCICKKHEEREKREKTSSPSLVQVGASNQANR